jgi:hypothetical protein
MRSPQLIPFFSFLFLVILTSNAQCIGLFELGGSANYKQSYISPEARDQTINYTGSLSYYFLSQSALELSYTNGQSYRHSSSTDFNVQNIYNYSIAGADLVLVFAERNSRLVPYIKMGGARYLNKRITTNLVDRATGNILATNVEEIRPTTVPSAGIGVKISLTQTISLKLGIDAWASQALDVKPMRFDTAARVGLSWFL